MLSRWSPKRLIEYVVFVLPVIFLILGIVVVFSVYHHLSIHGYMSVLSSNQMLENWNHTGISAGIWPPFYTVITTLIGSILGMETGGRLISLFAGTGFLFLLPVVSQQFGFSVFPGCIVNLLLLTNVEFLVDALKIRPHMLSTFLVLLSIVLAIIFFKNNSHSMFVAFFVVATLASLTKYAGAIVFFAFIACCFCQSNKKTVSALIYRYIPLFAGIHFFWFCYNYFVNRHFIAFYRGPSLYVVKGMIEKGLTQYTYQQWLFKSTQFFSPLQFLLYHQEKYFQYVWLNFLEFSQILIDLPYYGIFSVFVALGIVFTLVKSNQSRYLFLTIILLLTAIIRIPIDVQHTDFLHLGSVFVVVALGSLLELNQISSGKKIRKRSLFFIFMALLSIGYVYQLPNRIGAFRQKISNQFMPQNKYAVYKTLKRLRKNHSRSKKLRVMSSLYYQPVVYQAGMSAVLAPIPFSDEKSIVCYTHITQDDWFLIRNINFPSYLSKPNYTPPDYLLMGYQLGASILNSPHLSLDRLRDYLGDRVASQELQGYSYIELYEVKKGNIHC